LQAQGRAELPQQPLELFEKLGRQAAALKLGGYMQSDRIVPVEFSEEEWQFLRQEAERAGTTVQQEARESVRNMMTHKESVRGTRL
jgi:hypothetical protein